ALGDRLQIGCSGSVRMATALLPVFQRREGDAIRHRETLLRHVQRTPDCAYIRNLDGVRTHTSLSAARMRYGLGQAFKQLVCEFANRFIIRVGTPSAVPALASRWSRVQSVAAWSAQIARWRASPARNPSS